MKLNDIALSIERKYTCQKVSENQEVPCKCSDCFFSSHFCDHKSEVNCNKCYDFDNCRVKKIVWCNLLNCYTQNKPKCEIIDFLHYLIGEY